MRPEQSEGVSDKGMQNGGTLVAGNMKQGVLVGCIRFRDLGDESWVLVERVQGRLKGRDWERGAWGLLYRHAMYSTRSLR